MRLWQIIAIFTLALPAQASLAPRMYSIMAQVNAGVYQATAANEDQSYNNKLSIELLYLVRGGPTFGGRYMIESRNENQSNTGQAYGPMAGYYADNGFFAVFTYDVLAKLGRWTNGEGFEVSAGYLEHIGDGYHVGAQFSVRKIRYKTDITNNVAVSKDVTDHFPSLSLMYLF
ncbi:MAG: hypothetical protein K0R29_66 [Pseudobdellovibrio sp.]|jgi:hypothetical protein|nr:hypothetical protein [Pseudobdellovibrio sp.]